jgi:acetyl esterase
MTRLFFRPPKNFFNDPECKVEKIKIKTFDGKKIKAYVLTPTNLKENAPCLVNFHGGGFILDAAKHHYQLAKRYAIDCSCKVIFPKYRLAPKYKFPFAFEDCYSTLTYVYDNAEKLGIDKNNIGVGGDSAGGTLSVSSCIMAKDRKHPIKVRFQMLSYPFLDGRCSSRSAKKYTDTPMWNSTLSAKVRPYFLPDLNVNNVQYASPLQIKDYEKMPTAYIETAEFDSLHDDGILFSKRLNKFGIKNEVNQTKGTMHGFDICYDAPTTQQAIKSRVEFMNKHFK